jgi:hypoxanthine phosphoribosyltransferase
MDQLQEALQESGLGRFLDPDVTLVPAPRSAPLSEPAALWPGRMICEELVTRRLGKEVVACLERTEAVPKSAYADKGGRPTAERHLETMRVERALFPPRQITVVDDIVTIGRTLLAAASHLRAAFPEAELRAFALIHTYGLTPEIERIDVPYIGVLKRTGGWIGHDPPQ